MKSSSLLLRRIGNNCSSFVSRSSNTKAASTRLISFSPLSPSALSSLPSSSFFSTTTSSDTSIANADPASKKYKYWNREEYARKGRYDYLIKISPESIIKEANILVLADDDDDANSALSESLPFGSKIICTGSTLADFNEIRNNNENNNPNVIFVSPSCPKARKQLPLLLAAFPSVEWVHVRSAGIDFVVSEALDELAETNPHLKITNAKGQFSSSLAEYAMMACSYFAKDLPRLLKQKQNKNWEKYDVEELRGKTMGIVGYGDIGRAVCKIAHVYGMKIVALRRNPKLSVNDEYCNVVYGTDKASLNKLMGESDYIVCSAPSTVETRGMVNADAFAAVKDDAVFINLGRGPVVDEEAMVEALKSGKLKGAALDVFAEEPLPKNNELWELDNVLLSPHNMDQTNTFMHEATEFFVFENLPRFICGKDLLNPVDPQRGY